MAPSPIPLSNLLLSLYGLRHSVRAIANLTQYEAATSRAAQYSSKVARELTLTRTTQGVALVSLLWSLCAAAVASGVFPGIRALDAALTSGDGDASGWAVAWMVAKNPGTVAAVLLAARTHVRAYWTKKPEGGKGWWENVPAGTPGMGEYREAVKATEEVVRAMEWRAGVWVVGWGLGMVVTGKR